MSVYVVFYLYVDYRVKIHVLPCFFAVHVCWLVVEGQMFLMFKRKHA